MKLNEVFQVNDTLNPKIWNITTKELLPEVKDKIVEVVSYFEDYCDVPINIVDIQVVGSNASYNYTATSDLDVHIIANFESVTQETILLQKVYDAKKSKFNSQYDITVHGVEIEIYVEDVKSGITSNGIYSVLDNKWVKEPKPLNTITKHNIQPEFEKWQQVIAKALASQNYDTINNCINTIYLIRHNSIATDGEYGKGNELFKRIRSEGYLDKLKDALDVAVSNQLSLESLEECLSLSKGQLVNILED